MKAVQLRVLYLGFLACMTACAHPPSATSATARPTDGFERVEAAELEAFRVLAAADARFAARAHVEPTQLELARAMQASMTAEEPAVMLGGGPDAFTRAPRAQAFPRIDRLVASLSPAAPAARAELAVLRAVVGEEEARFARETPLPAAAVRLIRALATLEPPRNVQERALNDAGLTRRLGEIEDSLDVADSLDGDSIQDALDELEPRVGSVYPEATKALTSLRLAVSHGLKEPQGARPLPALAAPLSPAPKERWTSLRQRLRAELVEWRSAADSVNAGDRERDATELLLGRATCGAPTRPASLSLPPERAFGCRALVKGTLEPLLLEVVVHDLLTLGLWSLEIAADRQDYRRVLSQYAMAGRVPGDVGGKLARRVAAEPELGLRAATVGEELAALPPSQRARWIQDYLARGAFLERELR